MLLGRSMAQAKGKKATEIQKVTFSCTTIRFVETLTNHGTHGSSVNDVIRSLVEEGVRRAIADGILKVEDGQD